MARQVPRPAPFHRAPRPAAGADPQQGSSGNDPEQFPQHVLEAIGLQVLATEAASDVGVARLSRFLERRGLLLQPGLVLMSKTSADSDELLAIALGYFGTGVGYVVHSRSAGLRDAAAFVVGGSAFAEREGEIRVMPLRAEQRQTLATWPFSMSLASNDPAVRSHCNSVCGPCFLWLASYATLSYSCALGRPNSCPAALAARGQAELYCLQCVGCDWSP